MKEITCTRSGLSKAVEEIIRGILGNDEPLYRGLGRRAEADYMREKILRPYPGDLATGTGVFFSNCLETALGYASQILVVSSRNLLDFHREAVDTQIEGYDLAARRRLDEMFGSGNYDGYRLWAEIQKKDTLTRSIKGYIYTGRKPVTMDKLIAEIRLIDKK